MVWWSWLFVAQRYFFGMETEHDLNTRIMNQTAQIQQYYPELYRNLNEMYATLPINETPVINATTLRAWSESLKMLILQYDSAREHAF